jgi:hypothetical protein
MYRTLPARTRSVSAPSVSSIGISGLGRWTCAQAPQRVVAGPQDVEAGVALVVRAGTGATVHLRREHDAVAAPGERTADDDLALALVVHVRRIDEVEPAVERGVDDPDRLGFAGGAAEVERAEAQRGHAHTRPPQ